MHMQLLRCASVYLVDVHIFMHAYMYVYTQVCVLEWNADSSILKFPDVLELACWFVVVLLQ